MATTGTRIKIGWDESEAKELQKALKQALLVQTPLQVLLETLFNRIQAQASQFAALEKRMERIEVRDLTSQELLSRVKMCEDALSAINHEKLSPFHQQEILSRLDELEERVANTHIAPPAATADADGMAVVGPAPTPSLLTRRPSAKNLAALMASTPSADMGGRLEALEARLAGVYNLGGKLMAVEAMAAEMGVEIPDVDVGLDQNGRTLVPPLTLRGVGAQQDDEAADDEDGVGEGMGRAVSFHLGAYNPLSSNNTSGSPRAAALMERMAKSAAASKGISQSNSPAISRTPSNGALTALVGGAAAAGGASKLGSPMGTARVREPSAAGSRPQSTMRMGDVLAQVEVQAQEIVSLREMVAQLQADVAALGDVPETAVSLAQRLEVAEVSAREMRENLMTELAAVRKESKREVEVSFADFTALGSRVDGMESSLAAANTAVSELKQKVVTPLSEAVSDLKDQMKRAGEPRDMDTLFHNRITKLEATVGDVKSEVQLAVGDVLEDVARVADIAALEEMLDAKAEQADVRQLAQQQAALAQSVNGIADWLAVRPDTADGAKGTGASATKFKCLTCDREIRGQSAGPQGTERTAKGSFLPKLEGLPGGHSGAPLGPGINAAEMRRLAEDKLGGSMGRKGASPPRGADLDEYGGVDGRSGSPGHARSGRQAIPMTSSAFVPKASPGQGRTPVFL